MWLAENVAELALIFACAFLVLIVSLPFVLKQVEFITTYMRRPRFTENSSSSNETPEAPRVNSIIVAEAGEGFAVNRYSIASWRPSPSGSSPLRNMPIRILPLSSSASTDHSFESPPNTSDPLILPTTEEDISLDSGGLLSAPITPNSDLSAPASPIVLSQTLPNPQSELPESMPSPPSHVACADEGASTCDSDLSPPPPSSYVGCQEEPVTDRDGHTDYRRLRRLPSFMSSTTMRSLRTQPPCYQEEVPFDEIRLDGGPTRGGHVGRSDSR